MSLDRLRVALRSVLLEADQKLDNVVHVRSYGRGASPDLIKVGVRPVEGKTSSVHKLYDSRAEAVRTPYVLEAISRGEKFEVRCGSDEG